MNSRDSSYQDLEDFLACDTSSVVSAVVNDVIHAAASVLYERYVSSLEPDYAVMRVITNLNAAFEWLNPTVDESEPPVHSWDSGDEPAAAAIDSWARCAVPTYSSTASSHVEFSIMNPPLLASREVINHNLPMSSSKLRSKPSLFASHPTTAVLLVPDAAQGGRRRVGGKFSLAATGKLNDARRAEPQVAQQPDAQRLATQTERRRVSLIHDGDLAVHQVTEKFQACNELNLRAQGVAATVIAEHAASLRQTSATSSKSQNGRNIVTAKEDGAAGANEYPFRGTRDPRSGTLARVQFHERLSNESAILSAHHRIVGSGSEPRDTGLNYQRSLREAAEISRGRDSDKNSIHPTVSVGSAPPWYDS